MVKIRGLQGTSVGPPMSPYRIMQLQAYPSPSRLGEATSVAVEHLPVDRSLGSGYRRMGGPILQRLVYN